jgi:hypothetical protein
MTFRSRLRTTLAVSAVALATVPAIASAQTPLQPVTPGGGDAPKVTYCYYAGQKYSEGSQIRFPNGNLYYCRSGEWK